jgi:hypothetical protein
MSTNMLKKNTQVLALRPRHQKVLDLVGRLSVATPEQVNSALYSKGTMTTTATALLDLYTHRYLDRVPLRTHPLGNPKWVWKLKARGHRYLTRELGIVSRDLIRPSDNLTSAASPLQHAVESNDLIVKALQIARGDPSLWVDFKAEPQLRHEDYKRRREPSSPNIPLVPDAWVKIIKVKEEGAGEAVLWFELDRGSVPVERMRARMEKFLEIDGSEAYEEIFKTRGFVVVFAITKGGNRRLQSLLKTAERVLKESRKMKQSDLFLFGCLEGEVKAEDFFFNPYRFHAPFASQSRSVLPLSWYRPAKGKGGRDG